MTEQKPYTKSIIIKLLMQMGVRSLDENGNPINVAATGEPRLARSNLGLGSVSMASCGTTSSTCRQLRPLSIYRHNPAFHSQHVAAVGCPSQTNSESRRGFQEGGQAWGQGGGGGGEAGDLGGGGAQVGERSPPCDCILGKPAAPGNVL